MFGELGLVWHQPVLAASWLEGATNLANGNRRNILCRPGSLALMWSLWLETHAFSWRWKGIGRCGSPQRGTLQPSLVITKSLKCGGIN
ncbi:hypothetical protein Syun_026108 [Stephania yunnanensis]|uniref:Uncharacterized protein n=1 Tax=Stephania yunnanensis TaxID=152371 RepID=A0AAP0EYD9_9MAGN